MKVEHRSVYVSARHIILCLYFIDTRTFLARTYSTQNTSQFKFEDPLSPPVGHDSADDRSPEHSLFSELASRRWDKTEWRETHAYSSLNLNLIML